MRPAEGTSRRSTTLTIRFRTPFDRVFQDKLHARALASGRNAREQRLEWGATPPDGLPGRVREAVPPIEVPTDAAKAYLALRELLDDGHDAVISAAFDKFAAALKHSESAALLPAYLAEINLGVTGQNFDARRVREGVRLLHEVKEFMDPASHAYCTGNAHLPLGEFDEAKDWYLRAQVDVDASGNASLSAQAAKNLGSVMSAQGDTDFGSPHGGVLRFGII